MELLKKLWHGWKKFGEIIGHFMSTIMLGIIYIIVITPFAVCYKIFNKHFFRYNRNYETYWVLRKETEATIENYRRQY